MEQTASAVLASLCKTALESTVGNIARNVSWTVNETVPPRIGEVPMPQCVYALVSGDQLKILVKLHFSGRSGLLPRKPAVAGGRPSFHNETAFREVCNVLAGRLKTVLSERGLVLGQSLPVAVDALDEILSPVQEGYPGQAAWRVDAGESPVLATFHWQMSGDGIGQALARTDRPAPDSSGAIEVF